MKKQKHDLVTIAVHNLLFDGVSVKNKWLIFYWLYIHLLVSILGIKARFVHRKQLENQEHPVDTLLENFDPDILILQEVMPGINNHTIQTLKDKGYTIAIGYPRKRKTALTRTTVIASRFHGTSTVFKMYGASSGGAVEFELKDSDITILAVHPSAANPIMRKKQLKIIAQKIKSVIAKGRKPILAGDFNAEPFEFAHLFQNLPITHFTHPSFPQSLIWNRLQKPYWKWLKKILMLSKGQRAIDHIFIPKDWLVKQFSTFETSSDHVGLLLKAHTHI